MGRRQAGPGGHAAAAPEAAPGDGQAAVGAAEQLRRVQLALHRGHGADAPIDFDIMVQVLRLAVRTRNDDETRDLLWYTLLLPQSDENIGTGSII